MPIIKRYRRESLSNNGVATIYLKTSFLGIPIYEDRFDSTSSVIVNQFTEINEQPITGLYDVNNIGFKQE